MSNKIKFISYTLAAVLLHPSAYANCLSSTPKNQKEINNRIEVTKKRIIRAQSDAEIFSEIARDAEKTSSQAKIIAGASIAPGLAFSTAVPLVAGFVSSIGAASSAAAVAGIAGAGAAGAATIYDVIQIVSNTKKLFRSSINEDDLVQKAKDKVQSRDILCSFDGLYKNIHASRDKIYKTDLSGSIISRAHNSIKLGGVQRDATQDLLGLALLEKEIAFAELNELNKLGNYSTEGDSDLSQIQGHTYRTSLSSDKLNIASITSSTNRANN